MMNEETIQLILKYIDSSLTEAEKHGFDERFQQDAAFRLEVSAYEEAKLAAIVGGQSRIKNLLKEEAAKYKEQQKEEDKTSSFMPPKITPLKIWVRRGVAAAFIIVACLLASRYFRKPILEPEKIFATYFTPLEDLPITRFRADNTIKIDSAFRQRHDSLTLQQAVKALDFYIQKNYVASLEAFNQLQVTDDTLSLCKATALLATDNIPAAQTILTVLAQKGRGYPQPYSEWYLALSYLKQGNLTDCRTLLEKISANDQHPFKKNARSLLGELNLE